MRFVFVGLVTAFVLFQSAQGVAGAPPTDRQQILQLERDWCQSFVTNDVEANERIVADDYVGTGLDGRRFTKRDLIASLKSEPRRASDHLNEDDVTIRFYGKAAVVNGSETWKDLDGKAGRNIWTDVFVERNGRWQVVASQDLAVSNPKQSR
jgi:hypothetical protein